MRGFIRWSLAALAAFAISLAAAEPTFARGGGGMGGGGGPGGGGKGGSKGGGAGGPKAGAGGVKKGTSNKAKSAGDYLDQQQREDAEAQLAAFLAEARYTSLVNTATDDRGAALRAARDKASTDRRDTTESGAHPL